ncbi:MAG: hypothetical protein ACFFBP_03470 [Promethearchaeota archaeon]
MKENKKKSIFKSNSPPEDSQTIEFGVWYFFSLNLISFLVPFYTCLGLFLLFEFFIISIDLISSVIHFLLLPGFLLFLYYLYLIILIETAAIFTRRWNKKSPPKQGVFKRDFKDKKSEIGRIIHYYHKRGYIIKFPMWLTSKSPFPWLINRTLRRIGHNKIGKNVIYCDAYVGLEFTEIGDNTFIYPTSALSSHEVNSIFGKLSMLEIKIGQNNVLFPGTVVGPGVLTENNNLFYPATILPKNWRGVSGKLKYQGSPGRPIDYTE